MRNEQAAPEAKGVTVELLATLDLGAEFKHKGIRFSMYERAQLPELLGQIPSYPKGGMTCKDSLHDVWRMAGNLMLLTFQSANFALD